MLVKFLAQGLEELNTYLSYHIIIIIITPYSSWKFGEQR